MQHCCTAVMHTLSLSTTDCAVLHTCKWPLWELVRCCLREVRGDATLLHCFDAPRSATLRTGGAEGQPGAR